MRYTAAQVTQMLSASRGGEREAEAQLFELLYDELRRLAASFLRRERREHSLEPAALVNEVYLRLADQDDQMRWENRRHLFGIAARVMRRILVDHAREKNADKRGAGTTRVPLDETAFAAAVSDADVLQIHEALTKLATLDPRQARIVELRFFAGLSIEETADVLDCTPRTINRDWRIAKAWLARELSL